MIYYFVRLRNEKGVCGICLCYFNNRLKAMKRTIIYAIIMITAMTQTVFAQLTISLCDDFGHAIPEITRKKLDKALYEANGRDWYVDNILFSERSMSATVFFSPGNVLYVNSKNLVGKELTNGLKSALDFLADKGDTIYIDRPDYEFDIQRALTDKKYMEGGMEESYARNYIICHGYLYLSKTVVGKDTKDNSGKTVRLFYGDFTKKYPYNGIDIDTFYHKYKESCESLGLKPIANDDYARRAHYTDADIDHYLECRFCALDFYKRATEPEYSLPLLEYRRAKSNSGPFEYLETTRYDLERSDSCKTCGTCRLTLAAFPPKIDPEGLTRSVSMINKALYEANGRDWYVDKILFGARHPSSLYFTTGGLFTYMSIDELDSSFAVGIANAIDLLAIKKDTLYAPVKEWTRPHCDSTRISHAIKKWQERNLDHLLFSGDWKTKISTAHIFLTAFNYGEDFDPFGFYNLHLWPRLDNGTKQGRIFRREYEKGCRRKGLKAIGEPDIETREHYSEEDIDFYLDWVMKADDYYIGMTAPSVYYVMDISYPLRLDTPVASLTVKEECRE